MRVGIPTEIKNNEGRVGITPAGVDVLVSRGHDVYIQSGAGSLSGVGDAEYQAAGAKLVSDAESLWNASDMVVKVKEPVAQEYQYLRPDLVLFTYLHLAAERALTEALLNAGTTAIAYETVQLDDRSLPLLTPMSEIAGRLASVVGAHTLMRSTGGRGVLLGGVAGTRRGKVVVIGGGIAGEKAAANALGLGAEVVVLDVSLSRVREREQRYGGALQTRVSTPYEVAEQVTSADLVIGSVLIPGASAPKLVTDDMVANMRPGAVLVDIAIDQGGCFEGSRATTHDDPVFRVHDVNYYCVANMPGAVPETSTTALTNATLPFVAMLADHGWQNAAQQSAALARGVSTNDGKLMNQAVAEALGVSAGIPVS